MSYRQMRRQARQARRAGMQPMMFVNADQFPTPLGVILARWAWHYRSEFAPLTSTVIVLGTGLWLHLARPHWWPYLIAGVAVAALAVGIFGARVGLARVAERIYAAAVALAADGWLGAACVLGPFTSPLPQVLAAGTLILGVPWWAHRRRRAKVRVERTLAAWPDISRAVGLPGSQVQSATVDRWGWRARLRLARGQTIADVTARIPAIESALGTRTGSVRVQSTGDGKANRCELRVLDADPHAQAIPWPGPSARSITEPVDLGPFEDAAPCRVSFLRRHALFGGIAGSGKSGGLNVLMATLAACDDVVIWAIDLKMGMELQPWAPCIGRLATTPEEATALLADALAILLARAEWLAASGRRVWEPSPDMPALVIIIDEYAELADEAPEAMDDTDSIARLGRALAVTLVAATQRPTQKAMGQGAVRSQMDTRICFRVRERRDVDLILGQGMLAAGWRADALNAPGKFLISAPEHETPRPARAYLVTDDDVASIAARHARSRPRLDDVSLAALSPGAPPRPAARYAPGDAHSDPGEPDDAPGNPGTGTPAGTPWGAPGDAGSEPPPEDGKDADATLRRALAAAPAEGVAVADLIAATGMSRRWVFYRLRQLAGEGYAVQTIRGYWRAS